MSDDDPFFDGLDAEPAAEKPRRRGGRRTSDCWPTVPVGDQVPLRPYQVVQERVCHFKKKPEKQRGCARCGKAKKHRDHLGTSISLNVFGSGANRFTYQNAKAQWEEVFRELLEVAGLPKGLGRIVVEATMCFPDRAARDQGNFRFIVEKALGDCLVEHGWLYDDDWSRYEFGNLAYRYEKGRAFTELIVFPAWPAPDVPEPGEQAALAV